MAGRPEMGKTTNLEEYTRLGPGIWLKTGFLYVDWSSDMKTGVWKLYDWKEETVSGKQIRTARLLGRLRFDSILRAVVE